VNKDQIKKGAHVQFDDVQTGKQTGRITYISTDLSNGRKTAVVEVDHDLPGVFSLVALADLKVLKGSDANGKLTAEQVTAEWNANVNIGDKVLYRTHPNSEPQIFTTSTKAEILNGHTAVVWLNGKAGCVACTACMPVMADELA
jgi:hypothetical protein